MTYEIERLTDNGWAAVRLNIKGADTAATELQSMLQQNPKYKLRIIEVTRVIVFES